MSLEFSLQTCLCTDLHEPWENTEEIQTVFTTSSRHPSAVGRSSRELKLLTSNPHLPEPFIPHDGSRERYEKAYTGSYVVPRENVISTLQGSSDAGWCHFFTFTSWYAVWQKESKTEELSQEHFSEMASLHSSTLSFLIN